MSSALYNTPQEAETAFYHAFERADIDLMSSVWAHIDGIECVHPLSDRLSGNKDVLESWRSMFQQPPGLSIKIEAQQCVTSSTLAVHIVDEHITMMEGDNMQQSVIHATNVYQLIDSNWQMVVHHASPSRRPQQKQSIRSESIH
ncbi:MAG: nuclear transport factor 2 family protein [Gammaproteobacteria bacterium]|nr:nuclear transport factor 2 family protein [Gammaproteobacteria bacterium]